MHVPLANSFVISSKKGNETIVVPVVDKNRSTYEFRVQSTGLSKLEIAKAQNGTKAGKEKDFVCSLSGSPIQMESQIGRASCRARVCQYVSLSGVDRYFTNPTSDTK